MTGVLSLSNQLRDVPSDYTDLSLAGAANDCTEPLVHATPPGVSDLPSCSGYGWKPRAKPARVFDMFTYYDEIDLLEARLHELNSTVDVFVIAEANATHKHGRGKPSHLKREMHRLAPFAHKIVHVWARVHCPGWFWVCEDQQREMLLDGFLRAGGQDDDVVIVSDADEIPRPSTVATLRGCDFEASLSHQRLLRLHANHFFYSLHCERVDHLWPFVAAASGRLARTYGMAQMRRPYSSGRPSSDGRVNQSDTTQKHMPYQLPVLTVACKSHHAAVKWEPQTSLHLYKRQVTSECPAGGIEEYSLPNASWHFSYFGSVERYRAKMFAANVMEGKWGASVSKGEAAPFDVFLKSALQCTFRWKPRWRTAVRVTVPTDVPSFVMNNPCRMRSFFAHSSVPGGNDWHLMASLRSRGKGMVIGRNTNGKKSMELKGKQNMSTRVSRHSAQTRPKTRPQTHRNESMELKGKKSMSTRVSRHSGAQILGSAE